MAVAHVSYFNKALQKEVGFLALLPDRQDAPGPYPVFYLLHGLSDDYTAWLRWTSIERYVRALPIIVVLPDGDRCFYCDLPGGPAHEKSLVGDLIPYVDRVFPTVGAREGRVIGGLSMGGYGSVKLALKYPDLFCSATAHSAAFGAVRGGDRGLPAGDCPFRLAEALDPSRAPALRFDCGVDDQLLAHNRDLHAHLEGLGIAHEYEEFPGGHTWDYWDVHVQEAVRFHCRALGISTGGE